MSLDPLELELQVAHELNPCQRTEQPVFLASELSPQPHSTVFILFLLCGCVCVTPKVSDSPGATGRCDLPNVGAGN